VDHDPEPAGDYGYDLVHEEARSTGRPEDQASPEHPKPAPTRAEDMTGDYGYDEAHGF
jgi:hypothetical protein